MSAIFASVKRANFRAGEVFQVLSLLTFVVAAGYWFSIYRSKTIPLHTHYYESSNCVAEFACVYSSEELFLVGLAFAGVVFISLMNYITNGKLNIFSSN